jgi:glycosyltransferase involved in cell wall biosynthesis
MDHRLRIAIDCRIGDSNQGVGTAVLALAKALSDSEVADQEYTFIVREEMQYWLAPYIYGPCSLATIPTSKSLSSFFKRALHPIAPLRFVWHKLRAKMAKIPVSDGYVESRHFDVVHFPTQSAYLTDLPSIYQPWDLQHLHYPQFFTKIEFVLRERYYPAFCDRASFVCVQSQWTKQDVIDHYGIAEEKIVVIPWGSVFQAYEAPAVAKKRATTEKYGLPDRFFLYPAVTWPHKNHESILRALHLLKSKYGSTPHVYFTGASTEYRSTLDKLAQDLNVSGQVHFLGFLTSDELQAVFGAATAMVFPSKFEGFGLPILEAFQARLPVLCSNATTLPEVAKDAALYFDPDSPVELASLMKTILDVPEVRQELIRKGTLVLSHYSINDTAASFQALYKETAALSSRDTGRNSQPVSA